jgi:uncharacterized Zn finger protein (UPF0148 family)
MAIAINCSICFESAKKFVTCGAPDCDVATCADCINDLVSYCYREDGKSVPSCPGSTCSRKYLVSRIENALTNSSTRKYEEICAFRLDSFDTEKSNREVKNKMLTEFRKSRVDAIKTFPAAIAKLAEICFKNKMLHIDRDNRRVIENLLSKTRSCPDVLCDGRLAIVNNGQFECIKCENTLCGKCDELIKSKTLHVCDQRNVDTVNYINLLVMCPKCKLPVVKNYGCDYVTCAICKTNFNYQSGAVSIAGNHQNVTVTLAKQKTLMTIIDDEAFSSLSTSVQLEYIALFERINARKPNPIQTAKSAAISAAKRYEHLSRNRAKCKLYASCLKTIFEHYENRTLTIDVLKSVLKAIH